MPIQPAEQDIRERAYRLWEARGRPTGSAEEDWHEAEQQLKTELDAVSAPLYPLAAQAADALENDAALDAAVAPPRERMQ